MSGGVPMSLPVVEPRTFPLLTAAYADLAEGLRSLADDLGTPRPEPDRQEPPEDPAPSFARDAVVLTVRGLGAVLLQSVLLASALLLGFHVWMTVFPPLRPSV